MSKESSVAISDPRQRTLVLIAMCAALVAVVSSVSSLNIAQSAISLDLNASQGNLLWVVNAYTLALAALLLPIGALGDRWGRKPILMAGLTLFSIAGVLAGSASSVAMLIAARVGMGVAAAMIMPATLSIITSSFPAEARSTAVGVWSGFAGAGGVLGLLISAFMLEHVTWPWLFAPAIALSLAALVLIQKTVPNSREGADGRFDVLGSMFAVLAVGGFVLGIHEGPDNGWTDPFTVFAMAVGVLALLGFVTWELRQRYPLLDVRIFRDRRLAAGAIGLLVMFIAMFGIMLVLIQYLTAVAGLSLLAAALAILPLGALMMGISPIAPKLARRFGGSITIAVGVFFVAIGLAAMAIRADGESYLAVLPGMLLMGLGLGLAMTPGTTAITSSLGPDKQGVASALNDTVREVASSIGIALLGSVLNSGYRSSIGASAKNLSPEVAAKAKEGIAAAGQVAAQIGTPGKALIHDAQSAFVDGLTNSLWVAFALAVIGGTVVLALARPSRATEADPVEGSADPLLLKIESAQLVD